jgi:hypothetical protein
MPTKPVSQGGDICDIEELDFVEPDPLWDKPAPPIWHYTSADGFFGIVRDKGCLRATDVNFLNDASEVKYGLEVVTETIRKELPTNMHEEVARDVAELLSKRMFVASFSKSCDLLSQWRFYADDGRGYCIRFDVSQRLAMVEIRPDTARLLVSCTYGPDELRSEVTKQCRRIANATDRPSALVRMARAAAVATKAPMFGEEKEVRIVVDHAAEYAFYHVRRGQLVPFVYTDPLTIAEVKVGPCAGKHAQEATLGFLRSEGMSAEVGVWDAPYKGRSE